MTRNTKDGPTRSAEGFQLKQFRETLSRHRRLVLGAPVLAVLLTGAFLLIARPTYDAGTSIQIEQRSSGIRLVEVLQSLGSQGAPIHTEMEVLQSRTLAESVVDSLDLQVELERPSDVRRSQIVADASVQRSARAGEYRLERVAGGRYSVEVRYRLPGEDGMLARLKPKHREQLGEFAVGQPIPLKGGMLVLAPGAAKHDEIRFTVHGFQDAVAAVRDELAVTRPNREADVVAVGFQGPDPEIVRDVPNTLAHFYVQRRQGNAASDAGITVQYLRAQLDSLTRQMRGAERDLREFQEAERIIDPEAEASARFEHLAEMKAQRDVLDAERSALVRLLEQLREGHEEGVAAYRRLFAFPTLLRNPGATELLASLFEVENNRAALLGRRTADDAEVRALTQRIDELETQLQSIALTYVQGLTNQVRAADAVLAASNAELQQIPAKHITLARMQREGEVLGDIYGLLQTRLKESEIAATLRDNSVRIVDPAIQPLRPIKPNKPLSLALAVFFGLFVGVALAFARDYTDSSVRSREELQASHGLPVLGIVPRLGEPTRTNGRFRLFAGAPTEGIGEFRARLVRYGDSRGAAAEAYRALRTSIGFASPNGFPKLLLVTSPMRGDGKTTTAANLATTMAEKGARVLLVDADLRGGHLAEALEAPSRPGLAQVLEGNTTVAAAVRSLPLANHRQVDLLPAGGPSTDAPELLSSARMVELLAEMRRAYDAVVFDAPSMDAFTDAVVLATAVDGVLVVARAGLTDREELNYSLEQLRAVSAPIVGAVLNDVERRRVPRAARVGRSGAQAVRS